MEIRKKYRNIPSTKRKAEHIEICLNEPVQFKDITTGLEHYRFIHNALPDTDLENINTGIELFGKNLAAPLIISPMVGGITRATVINRNLARAAQKLGLAMGVGSQRILVDYPETLNTFKVRDVAPDILLLANLGAVQLNYGVSAGQCLKIVESIDADALVLHLNPLQEAVQPEGNTNYKGLIGKIKRLCHALSVPVVIKEVGCGISGETASRLFEAGVAGIDVAGSGGTCWSEIERKRISNESNNRIAAVFSEWGIPTSDSIKMVRDSAPGLQIIASGGIRTGIDVAKSIALGANAAGIALPLLMPAVESAEAVMEYLNELIKTLKITMFCIGASGINDIKPEQLINI